MRLVICSLAILGLLACTEKKVEETVPAAVSSESTETVVATDAGVAVAPVATQTPPVETADTDTACPPSCFVNGTMHDTKPADPVSVGTTSK